MRDELSFCSVSASVITPDGQSAGTGALDDPNAVFTFTKVFYFFYDSSFTVTLSCLLTSWHVKVFTASMKTLCGSGCLNVRVFTCWPICRQVWSGCIDILTWFLTSIHLKNIFWMVCLQYELVYTLCVCVRARACAWIRAEVQSQLSVNWLLVFSMIFTAKNVFLLMRRVYCDYLWIIIDK